MLGSRTRNSPPACKKTHLFSKINPVFSLCLSRACLGKVIILVKNGAKDAFSYSTSTMEKCSADGCKNPPQALLACCCIEASCDAVTIGSEHTAGQEHSDSHTSTLTPHARCTTRTFLRDEIAMLSQLRLHCFSRHDGA
jgi:hypothetical protein|eukprot:COSAG06_NODE_693_length_13038_cov_3.976428_3_plen_139_part_00